MPGNQRIGEHIRHSKRMTKENLSRNAVVALLGNGNGDEQIMMLSEVFCEASFFSVFLRSQYYLTA